MRTSHNLTRLFLALSALIALCAMALGQGTDSVIQVSDQKAGSLLVYPYYASGAAGSGTGDTRLTISNVGPTPNFAAAPFFVGAAPTAATVAVHVFFLDATCAQADIYLCLTPNASVAFRASEYDPFTTRGSLYAVAVDTATGLPIAYNGLIGNAFVNYTDASGRAYIGNYGAEAFNAIGVQAVAGGPFFSGVFPTPAGGGNFNFTNPAVPGAAFGTTATLLLNNAPRNFPLAGPLGYDGAPNRFAVEIQSPANAIDQTIVMTGLTGIVGGTINGTAQVGVGTIINGNERPFGSFTGFGSTACSSINILTAAFPRVPLGLNGLIPSGQVGTIQYSVGAAVGLLMTPQRVGQTANAWSGIRTLHKTSAINAVALPTAVGAVPAGSLTIPIFIPVC